MLRRRTLTGNITQEIKRRLLRELILVEEEEQVGSCVDEAVEEEAGVGVEDVAEVVDEVVEAVSVVEEVDEVVVEVAEEVVDVVSEGIVTDVIVEEVTDETTVGIEETGEILPVDGMIEVVTGTKLNVNPAGTE